MELSKNKEHKVISDANLLAYLLTAGFKSTNRFSYQGRVGLQFEKTPGGAQRKNIR